MGAAGGALYLAKTYGKFRWRIVLPGIFIMTTAICFFCKATTDPTPWYLKRMDFSRPSAQHRVAAWRAGVEIMRDHPWGVGWDKAVDIYKKDYSPPEDGATAITTNDYLMLGTQLGLPALICFVACIALCFKSGPPANETHRCILACRAGVLTLLVAFWFDGGLFKFSTACIFWILLELAFSPTRNQPRRASVSPA